MWIAAHPGGHHPKSFCNWDGASKIIFMSFSKRLWRRGRLPGEQGGAPARLDVVKKDTNDCKHGGPPIVVKGQLQELLEGRGRGILGVCVKVKVVYLFL